MRFFLFLGCFIGLTTLGLAQITVTSSDMPSAGYTSYQSVPDSFFSVDVEQTGANVSWDYSTLEAVVQRKDSFISLGDAPFTFFFFFSGATAVRVVNTPDSLAGFSFGEGYEFFRTTSSQFESMGVGGEVNGLPIPLASDPRDRIYSLPLAYQNSDSSFSSSELNVPGFVYLRQEQTRLTEVDGWGNITTPFGSFPCLRVKAELVSSDSISLGDTLDLALPNIRQREYKWLANGHATPILQVNTVVLDTIEIQSSIWYLDEKRDVPILSEESPLENQALLLQPNPSQGTVWVDWEQQWGSTPQLTVMAIDGRVVHEQPLPNQLQQLDFRHLPPGTYVVTVEADTKRFTGKLVLQ
ncbi:MAG: T9SS type A sorting domain-containing protein [Bacteroidota bacterium]